MGADKHDRYTDEYATVWNTDVRSVYDEWDAPVTIVSDGAYGQGLFPEEPENPRAIRSWYEPHVAAWSEHATPQTTLWLWNTELGWAELHPLLEDYGWRYRGCNIWNKGIGHIAGNSNTNKLRKFPQVTEVCVQYVREPTFNVGDETLNIQEWIIHEWQRSGLTKQEANDACGVADAASRKYLTEGDLWYFPPPERMEAMVEYANEHGAPDGRPYFAPNGTPINAEMWTRYRAKFDCPTGVTNVWDHPQVSGAERLEEDGEAFHINQKPLELMRRIIQASTEAGDVVWEPFGGLCTGAVAAKELGRETFAAEIVDEYYETAVRRIAKTTPNTKRQE